MTPHEQKLIDHGWHQVGAGHWMHPGILAGQQRYTTDEAIARVEKGSEPVPVVAEGQGWQEEMRNELGKLRAEAERLDRLLHEYQKDLTDIAAILIPEVVAEGKGFTTKSLLDAARKAVGAAGKLQGRNDHLGTCLGEIRHTLDLGCSYSEIPAAVERMVEARLVIRMADSNISSESAERIKTFLSEGIENSEWKKPVFVSVVDDECAGCKKLGAEVKAALAGWKGANEETDQHKAKLREIVTERDRLRGEVEKWKESSGYQLDDYKAVRAENQSLREQVDGAAKWFSSHCEKCGAAGSDCDGCTVDAYKRKFTPPHPEVVHLCADCSHQDVRGDQDPCSPCVDDLRKPNFKPKLAPDKPAAEAEKSCDKCGHRHDFGCRHDTGCNSDFEHFTPKAPEPHPFDAWERSVEERLKAQEEWMKADQEFVAEADKRMEESRERTVHGGHDSYPPPTLRQTWFAMLANRRRLFDQREQLKAQGKTITQMRNDLYPIEHPNRKVVVMDDPRKPMTSEEVEDLLSATLHGPLPQVTVYRMMATLAEWRGLPAQLEAAREKLKHIKMAMEDYETMQMNSPTVLILGLRDIIESENNQ